MTQLWSPTPPELESAPEMAILAAVRAAVDLLTAALLAANPHLAADPDHLAPSDAEVRAARRIISNAEHLRRAIDHYRAAVDIIVRAHAGNAPDVDPGCDDIPF